MTRVEAGAEESLETTPEPTGGRSTGMADEKTLQNVNGRLSRIEGQIRGIRNMATEGRVCVDIVTQIAAVRAALKKVADLVVADHVHQWVKDASGNGVRDEYDVEELLKFFNQYYR